MTGRPKSEKPKKKRQQTPVMEQFFRAKSQYPDAILFFRLGDFYEMFFDDAVEASAILDIALTSRGHTADGERIPMAGVPHHAAANYLSKLLAAGRRVALCEQMADPSTVKGVVPREVVRVATPGLCLEPEALDARVQNYLVALTNEEAGWGIAVLELSTGELRAGLLHDRASVLTELVRLDPREVLIEDDAGLRETARQALPKVPVFTRAVPEPDRILAEVIDGTSLDDSRTTLPHGAFRASGAAVAYAKESHPRHRLRLGRIGPYDVTHHLRLDDAAVRNLEIVRTLGGERRGALLHWIDQTRTAMGARALRSRLLTPLTHVAEIRRRHDAVQGLVEDPELRRRVGETLREIHDLERLATRSELGLATPRDLSAIRDSLRAAIELTATLDEAAAHALEHPLRNIAPRDLCPEVLDLLSRILVDEPPAIDTKGGIIQQGVHGDLDGYRELSSKSKDVILQLEQRERERTGIGSLKIKYTRVFGYYIEITRSNLAAVPTDYRRKQTVASGERFVTDELSELQERILSADDRAKALEQELFRNARDTVASHAHRIRLLAARIAELDVHTALAEVAHRYGYTRPDIDDSCDIEIREGRHPVVEQLMPGGTFVPNDIDMPGNMMLITGPNMAGKSTVMRQVALSVLLAQAGSFIPAKSARIGVVDRIYTRVGASDNLAEGQSTFMVEMQEAATILRNATRRSLVILDEIGRGTSTYDGLAIAWSIAEHLHDAIGCRTMFATHYHELCELAAKRSRIENYNVAAREHGDAVVFLYQLLPGPANRSYGIAVAKLAGVPPIVLARAKTMLRDLECGVPLPSGTPARMRPPDRDAKSQLDLFGRVEASNPPSQPTEIQRTLRELDVDRLTPVDALVTLARLKQML